MWQQEMLMISVLFADFENIESCRSLSALMGGSCQLGVFMHACVVFTGTAA